MADFPTRYPDWATQDEVSGSGFPNKTPVPDEFKLSGLKELEELPRAYFNDELNLVGQWIRALKSQFDSLVVSSSSAVLQQVFRVGQYWISDDTSNPGDVLGFGTWEKIKGRFLVGHNEADPQFDGIGETGGSKTHTHDLSGVTVGYHTLTVAELPSTNPFSLRSTTSGSASTSAGASNPLAGDDGVGSIYSTTNINWSGGGQGHNHPLSGSLPSASNLPPYQVTNIWRRIA